MVGRLRANKLSYQQGLDADPGALQRLRRR
jgi:hypothetical protein